MNLPNINYGSSESSSVRSRPRLVKVRKQTSAHHSRFTPSHKADMGFNPFRVSSESVASVPGNSDSGRIPNETFIFGASGMGNSNAVFDGMRKLKIVGDIEDVGLNNKNVFDETVVSELPNEIRKLNIGSSGNVGSSSHISQAMEPPSEGKSGVFIVETMNNFVFGRNDIVGDSFAGTVETVLPVKLMNLNIKDSLNACDEKEVKASTTDDSYVSGSVRNKTGNLGGISENWISDEMQKLKVGSEAESSRPKKEVEFTFTSKSDSRETPHVEFKTPNLKGNIFSGVNSKLEAKKESTRGIRSKKKKGKLRKPITTPLSFGEDFVSRERSSLENPDYFESYSPMDVSPYWETLADNNSLRETSVTSDETYQFNNNDASSESHPTVSNEATDEDLLAATHRLDINEGDVNCSRTRDDMSEYYFNKAVGAEGPSEESVSGAETESFKSATEHLDYSSDTYVTAVDTEVNSSATSKKQGDDGTTKFSSVLNSEDNSKSSFTFAASSSNQVQSSAETRQHKKKHRLKVGQDSCSSTPNGKLPFSSSSMEFFPLSGPSSLLSLRQGHNGDSSILFSRNKDKVEHVREQDIKQEPLLTSAESIAAQEACEKWRLRGNQAFNNGDLSKAEDYYTQGVNSVSQSETSRSCRRALMLCYSNRAATRMSLGRMKEALNDCLMATAIDPNFLRVQVRAANCYLALGDVEDASLHFKRCLQCRSDVCVDRKLLVEASEGLEKAQKVSEYIKQSTDLLQRRTSDDAQHALSVIDEALRISSCSEKLLEMKADTLFMLRKYEQVIQLCEQTLSSPEMNSLTSNVDSKLVCFDGSDLSRQSSSTFWRCFLMFRSYFYSGKLEEALDFAKKLENSGGITNRTVSMSLESVIPLADIVRELLFHKAAGNEAFQSRKFAEAVEHYTAALSCNVESRPFAAICFCNRAAAYRAMGQIADAIADCSLAIALDGNYLKAVSRRASLFEMIRDYGQATTDFQRLVSLLTKQLEEKGIQSGTSDKLSHVNELRQTQLRLSVVEEKARKDIPLDMYLILGVEPSATISEIKKAYRKAALRHHPDKAGQALNRSENADDILWREIAENVHKDADRLFKMIGEAYTVLSNPAKRSRYDLEEEIRNEPQKFTGSSMSRTTSDAQNYAFDQRESRKQWQDVWRSHVSSQSRRSERTWSKGYS